MPERLMSPTLVGDVLRVGIVGEFDGAAMRLLVNSAQRRIPEFGALLLDLTLAAPDAAADPRDMASAWLEQLPRYPCAALCSALATDYARRLALLLGSSDVAPTAMSVFDTNDRAAAWECAGEFAATYRDEQARRLRT